jgi:site-specific DNA-methyltransferase (adenine-specific)
MDNLLKSVRERILSDINLMQGDCLERMKEITNGSVDMVLTDPPYGTTACKWDSIIPLEPMWEQLKRVIKPNGAIVMTASQPFTTTLIASNMKMFKYCWVWEKTRPTGFFTAKKMPLKIHEDVCVFYSKPPLYSPEMTKADPKKIDKRKTLNPTTNPYLGGVKKERVADSGMRYPTTIKKVASISQKGQHPTQKPVALMEYLIKTYTNQGETVLDFTMGSGTTGVACVNTGRNFIGIELDAGYFEIAEERINNA